MTVPLTDQNGAPVQAVVLAKGDGTANPPSVAVSAITGTSDVRIAGDAGVILPTRQNVTNAATKLPSGGTLAGRRVVQLRNTDAALSVFLGAVGVTAATGWELVAGAAIALPAAMDVYAITAAATVRVDVLEIS